MPQGPSVWFDTRIYLAVAAALLLIIVFYNKYVALLGIILLGALYLYGRERYQQQQKALTSYLDTMTGGIDRLAAYAVTSLPVGMGLTDAKGILRWGNPLLLDWLGERSGIMQPLPKAWPELSLKDLWDRTGREVFKDGDRYYQVVHKPLTPGPEAEQLLALYFTDITAGERLRAECCASLPVLAFIQIDNYDDVLQGLSENLRTALIAEVNRLLADWVVGLDGFSKKYTEDGYFAIFSRQALEQPLKDKFEILDKIRAIRAGNRIPVTISMGVAADEFSVSNLVQRAQAGLDLALGRGGDQSALHIGGKVQFYGGKAKAVEKNTRVKARVVAQAIRELMASSDQVLIMGHTNEDFDSLGAALGIKRMARQLEKPAYIAVGKPGDSLKKLQPVLNDYEEYRGMVINTVQATAMVTARSLLVVVDTHRPELVSVPGLLTRCERVVVIDHHRRAETFIANPLLVYLEPSASSTSELVTELLSYFDERLELTQMEATALYTGIVLDTKNFTVQSGVRTFDAASFLRRAGADPEVVRSLYRLEFAAVKARAEIMSNTEMYDSGIIIATCPPGLDNIQIVAAQAADMLLRIEGAKMSFVLFPIDEGVGISARSFGEHNVQLIMEKLGGGGHQTVAGAQIKGVDIETVKRRVIELSANLVEESDQHEIDFAAGSEKTR